MKWEVFSVQCEEKVHASLLDLLERSTHSQRMRYVLLFFFVSLSGLFGAELKPGEYMLEMTVPGVEPTEIFIVPGRLSIEKGEIRFQTGQGGIKGMSFKGRLVGEKLIIYYTTESDEGVETYHLMGSLIEGEDGVLAKGKLGLYRNHDDPVQSEWRLLSKTFY
ncbi:hypothetical protein SAMN02745181_2211 [Rubritalea squalenifaciens DSM 18772]|uniref:Uncharacterized protein n=1 Tax=Rubritalea squalenifaciens DSM 18772 TaxID=1123071 RepID=A0A1M6KUX1_9BACT|nr:hypothetical protein [Rubritalea squalenifaciens]SHJ62736.1 hypothetical protein SAMN02745181_2211 [Rubritalea squalenifaciens DSM 18772]